MRLPSLLVTALLLSLIRALGSPGLLWADPPHYQSPYGPCQIPCPPSLTTPPLPTPPLAVPGPVQSNPSGQPVTPTPSAPGTPDRAPSPPAQTPTPPSLTEPTQPSLTDMLDVQSDLADLGGASQFDLGGSGVTGTGGGANIALNATAEGGYIDPAVPRTRFRFRFDDNVGNNRPDRAEFFYAKCGCFALLPPNNPLFDPNAPGPRGNGQIETNVDYQDFDAYLEYATSRRFSGFIEIPYRLLDPEINGNEDGFSDLKFGFRYAFVADPTQFMTFQLRTFVPTGNASEGLGTNHVSLEPALLHATQLTSRLFWQNEFRVWVPIGGTDFQGNVLRYGTGLGYLLYNQCDFRIAPTAEFVGWTVLNGFESDPETEREVAGGASIFNIKVGTRFGIGPLLENGASRSDLFIGYGRALTGEVWYENSLRVEFRLNF